MLCKYYYNLFQDAQGVHVIEKLIICYEEDLITFIYELIIQNFIQLANNCNGLCVIKKIIIHSVNPATIKRIQHKIIDNCLNLVQNPFGNYAIQVAVDVINYYNYLELASREYLSNHQIIHK